MIEFRQLVQELRVRRDHAARGAYYPLHFHHFADALRSARPPRIAAVLTIPFPSREDWSRLIAVARFRVPFSVILDLARVLAGPALNGGVVPTIVPLRVDRHGMTENTPLIRQIRQSGLLLYESVPDHD